MYKWLQKLFSTAYLQSVGAQTDGWFCYLQSVGAQIDGQFCYLQSVGARPDGRFVIYRVWEPDRTVDLLFTECRSSNGRSVLLFTECGSPKGQSVLFFTECGSVS